MANPTPPFTVIDWVSTLVRKRLASPKGQTNCPYQLWFPGANSTFHFLKTLQAAHIDLTYYPCIRYEVSAYRTAFAACTKDSLWTVGKTPRDPHEVVLRAWSLLQGHYQVDVKWFSNYVSELSEFSTCVHKPGLTIHWRAAAWSSSNIVSNDGASKSI